MHNGFVVKSSILTTKEKNPNRFLTSNKKGRETGFFFFILEIFSSETLGNKIKKVIIDKVDGISAHLDISEAIFEEVVEDINESIEKILEISDVNLLGKINSVFGFAGGDKIYLTQSGRLPGYIFRRGKISSLTEGGDLETPHPMQIFKDIVFGELIAGDKIVFGNNELFNHLSLDRIRKLTSEVTVKESVLELFTTLRKLRINDVNTIVIEATKEIESPKIKEMAEIIYLDEPEETIVTVFKNRYVPIILKVIKATWKYIKIFAHFVGERIKIGSQKGKRYWAEKASPKTKALLEKSHKAISNKLASGNKGNEIGSTYKKIKVKNPYAQKSLSGLAHVLFVLKSILQKIIKDLSQKENRKYVYIGLIIILIFFGYLKIRSNNSNAIGKKEQQEVSDAYDKAKTMFDSAKEDIALGRSASTTELSEALVLAEKGKKYQPTRDKSEVLYREIATQIDKYSVTTRIYPDSKNSAIVSSEMAKAISTGSEIFTFSKDGKTYSLGFSDNQAKLIASIGKDKGEIRALAYSEGDGKILLWTKDDKMISYDIKNKNFSDTPLSGGSTWITAVSFSIFSGNLYLLDSNAGQIIKYIREGDNFARNTTYADSKKSNLVGSVSLAVDGNVYVLMKEGTVIKLTKGIKDETFTIKNIPDPGKVLEEPKKIYTGAETNFIYVFESKQNRIVKFNKSGEFVSQYALGEGNIDDFAINEKLKKLIIISGTKIITAEL